ncbi:succinate dehydrogenase, hydrophobic membrane anchor protein [Pseudoroseomonas globiformis]|uniref:Succinate dehydrogenase hydrophobic membrane anchor subunit n=1 Tax=Teichococcus globiformis TaxID=2307229 RepID=A0ABV7FZR4_9PROT
MSEHVSSKQMQSPLGRVRGLGSAKGGVHHWWMQRVTSIALLPLTLWFVFSAASLAGHSYETTLAWIGRPFNAVLLLATIGLSFYHAAMGVQVVLEDYIRSEFNRMASILAVKALCVVLALMAMLAVLRIAV